MYRLQAPVEPSSTIDGVDVDHDSNDNNDEIHFCAARSARKWNVIAFFFGWQRLLV